MVRLGSARLDDRDHLGGCGFRDGVVLMTVRRLIASQRGPRCNHCTESAVWRGCYFKRFACTSHKDLLLAEDRQQAARDNYQTDAEWSLGL